MMKAFDAAEKIAQLDPRKAKILREFRELPDIAERLKKCYPQGIDKNHYRLSKRLLVRQKIKQPFQPAAIWTILRSAAEQLAKWPTDKRLDLSAITLLIYDKFDQVDFHDDDYYSYANGGGLPYKDPCYGSTTPELSRVFALGLLLHTAATLTDPREYVKVIEDDDDES